MFNLAFLNYVYSWEVYFSRFLMVFWFLIFPWIFLGFFLFFKELNKRKDVVFSFTSTKDFKIYGYVWHNFLFIFFLLILVFNTFVFFYSLASINSSGDNTLSLFFWEFKVLFSGSFTSKIFFSMISLGYSFHLLCFCIYIYFNLYRTNSYFAESFRSFLIEVKDKFLFLKKRSETCRLCRLVWRLFFEVNEVTLGIDDRKIITLD